MESRGAGVRLGTECLWGFRKGMLCVVCSDGRGGVQEGKALAADPFVSGSPSEQACRCHPLTEERRLDTS